jgi:hypothetical protein
MTTTRFIVIGAALAGFAATTGDTPRDRSERYPTIEIAIPPEAPRGSVAISSFGGVGLTVEGGQTIDAMHVRMVVANAGDLAPWTVDIPNTVLMTGPTRSHAIAVNADIATLPAIVVATGEIATIDLYFPRGDGELQLAWRVTTPTSEIHERTRFAGAAREHAAQPAGSGSHWWFAPSYPWRAYFHRDGILVPRPPESATVTRPVRHARAENPCDEW